ncbi:MAG: MBL fold metallo-hydrolase [Rhodospirillaceae bacterium]|nr:MBL fold metallo-hydrolase [Rhodospirillaceae bacterium]
MGAQQPSGGAAGAAGAALRAGPAPVGVPEVTGFFHEATNSVAYLVVDPATRRAAVIDAVLDFEPRGGWMSHDFADRIFAAVAAGGLRVEWVLETHLHADHLSAGAYLRDRLGAALGIGEHVRAVQQVLKALYNLGDEFRPDGSQFDRLFADGERLRLGAIEGEVLFTPGHTPACVSYRFGDAVFLGDTLFMPDYGTARCDFPGGDARTLYRSIRRLLALPEGTRLFTAHDYMPDGRPPAWESTVAAQRANKHLAAAPDEDAFVHLRESRDLELDAPALIIQALQVNMRGGRLPPPESNGVVYLKSPVNLPLTAKARAAAGREQKA